MVALIAEGDSTPPSSGDGARRQRPTVLLWTLFAIPIGYVGLISAVVVHEVLGHGCTAVLVGGEFSKFDVQFDGYGRAWTHTSSDAARVAVLAGGIASGLLLGTVLCLVARARALEPRLRLALLILAASSFHDALPYGLWDALVPGGHGDVSQILRLVGKDPLRALLVAGFGILYVAATCWTSVAMFRILEEALGGMSRRLAWSATTVMTLLMVGGYLAFDWDQLIPGVGWWPAVLIAVLQGGVGVYLARSCREVGEIAVARRRWLLPMCASWAAAAVTVFVVWRWLQNGVVL